MLAGQLKLLPNKLLIEGHTDAKPYSSDTGYTNWELSADRANMARRVVQESGVALDQIAQVRGFADRHLRKPKDPMDPANRRISVIVQYAEAPPTGAEKAGAEPGKAVPKAAEAKPAGEVGTKAPKGAPPVAKH